MSWCQLFHDFMARLCLSPAGFWKWRFLDTRPKQKLANQWKHLQYCCANICFTWQFSHTHDTETPSETRYSQPLPYTGWSAWSFHSLSLRWRSEPPQQLDRSDFCSMFRSTVTVRFRNFIGPGDFAEKKLVPQDKSIMSVFFTLNQKKTRLVYPISMARWP